MPFELSDKSGWFSYETAGILAQRRDSEIVALRGETSRAAKIYHAEIPRREDLEQKLTYLVNHPPDLSEVRQRGNPIAWPQRLLYWRQDKRREFVGYLMARPRGQPLSEWLGAKPAALSGKEPDLLRFRVGLHLAQIFAALHAQGYAVGGLDPSGVWVDEAGEVMLIDADNVLPISRRQGELSAQDKELLARDNRRLARLLLCVLLDECSDAEGAALKERLWVREMPAWMPPPLVALCRQSVDEPPTAEAWRQALAQAEEQARRAGYAPQDTSSSLGVAMLLMFAVFGLVLSAILIVGNLIGDRPDASPRPRAAASPEVTEFSRVAQAATAAAARRVICRPGWMSNIAYMSGYDHVAIASSVGVYLCDVRTRQVVGRLETDATVRSVAFSPKGRMLVWGEEDGDVRLWRVAGNAAPTILQGRGSSVRSVAISPDGRWVVAGSSDGVLRVWRAADGALLRSARAHIGSVDALAFAPDSSLFASGGEEGAVQLWRAETTAPVQRIEGHTLGVTGLAFSSDGQALASASSEGVAKVWRVADGALLLTLEKGNNARLHGVALSPDGQWIASGAADGAIYLWRSQDGRLLDAIEGHTDRVFAVVFLPNSAGLLSGSADGAVKLWDTP